MALLYVHMPSYYYIYALILLYMFPHATIYVSSYDYISVLTLLYVCLAQCKN
jgi:hypothetical protein